MKPQLIVFGEDWGAHPSSTAHLMHILAQDVDIVWINSIGLRRPSLRWRDLNRMAQKISARLFYRHKPAQPTRQAAPFPVISPLVMPLPKYDWLRRLNNWLLMRQLTPHLRAQHPPIVWTSLPSAVDYVDCFPDASWLYYCGDDFGALAGVDHTLVLEKEAALIQRVQRIWVASEKLAHHFQGLPVDVVEHGVDIQLFQHPQPRPADLPSGLILGFYGAIADWLDQALLYEVALRLPQCQIVIIGPILTDISELQACPNIHFLGKKPHHQLPAYVQHWTASILPFKDNEQIRACNPLKLREYLAVGTPVLTTGYPAMRPYADVVTEVSTSDDIVQALLAIETQGDSSHGRLARQRAVCDESWASKAQPIKHFLQSHRFAN